jgi:hypothetical protein
MTSKPTEQDYADRGLSRSYPYLSIARKYGIPYRTALIFNDVTPKDSVEPMVFPDNVLAYTALWNDVEFVQRDFQRMRREGW